MLSNKTEVGIRKRGFRRLGAACCCLLSTQAVDEAFSQGTTPASRREGAASAEPVMLDRTFVAGTRASLATSQQIKRESLDVVDSVVADDVLKLPDFSVTDALQRVTGVQIARDRGDGAAVTIRGLAQMETTLNGREIFTAGTGRTLDFSDIPAEMLAEIRVHKTFSAEQIEGGVGGWVDLRTRRPFDFADGRTAVSVRRLHSSLVGEDANQLSMLWTDRWRSASIGEFGALINVSRQDRAWREDQKSTGAPVNRDDLIPGRSIAAPNGTSETSSLGRRERTGASIVLQWRPSEAVELYAEGALARFVTRQDSYQINVSAPRTFLPGSVQLFPGTDDLQRITWTNAPISVLSFARDTVDRSRQGAFGGSWSDEDLSVRADLSYADSQDDLFFSGPVLGGTAATFTQDLSGAIPASSVGGTNLMDPGSYAFSSISYRTRPFEGRLAAAQVDVERQNLGGFFRAIGAGLRYARRSASNDPGLVFADAALSGIGGADRPGALRPDPVDNFLDDETSSIGSYLAGNLDAARNPAALRSAFGITAPIPSAGNPLSVWRIREETQAAYGTLSFKAGSMPLDGSAGLRIVRTQETLDGSRSVPDGGGSNAAISATSSYTDLLPSLHLRYAIAPGSLLRLALSKTVTRPNFDQLSPSLTLTRNTVDPSLNQGSAGNPELAPVRSRNLDIAMETYLDATTFAHVTAFLKRVTGFVTTVSSPETHDGITYQVSRPRNGPSAEVHGLELGFQHFFSSLPGAWRGLGLQANYTYVHSAMRDPASGIDLPLQNLSRNSLNLIGLYEFGPVSARIAYNWRDRFLSGISNIIGLGSLPIYTRGYGWLDASLRLRASDRVTLALEGNNLLATRRVSYYGAESRPQSVWINDVQIGVTATVQF